MDSFNLNYIDSGLFSIAENKRYILVRNDVPF